ncbi:MAG: glutamate---cysteine ligase / carboxylate-amine ligase [Thermoleophilaceae bacterium]|nr:glutamate---cysteine ligase / carboxylate-amine ligase [Thermoleophilaceae bacterium]
MLLLLSDWALAWEIDRVLPTLSPELMKHVTPETHSSALELRTGVHNTVESLATELRSLRTSLRDQLRPLVLGAASAGTHPATVWSETVLTTGERQAAVYGSMRELARREPTFGLHVHVGIEDPEDAIRLANAMRCHVPLLLALSANSPFWQGRDSGLASSRTPLFQAFPRVGIPRAFRSYDSWVRAVQVLIDTGAFPEPTFLWWDVRPQPKFGTVEVRIMDAQTTVEETAALVALVRCIARLEVEEGYVGTDLIEAVEALEENRFIAARDGIRARLIDPEAMTRRAVPDITRDLLEACAPHAKALGCEFEIDHVRDMAISSGAERQLALARGESRLSGLVAELADRFCA